MAKDPAFLFYSQDFIVGTQFFTYEQTGKYIKLLCFQHQHGRLTEKHMLNICGTYDFDIFSKFKRDESGLYYNERLEKETVKRKNYSESRRKNRNSKTTYVKHMENENVNNIVESNIQEVSNGDSSKIYPLNHCKIVALRDKSWVQKNRITPEAIDRFIEAMMKDGDYEKTPLEFKKHCRRWLDKQKQEEPTRKLKVL